VEFPKCLVEQVERVGQPEDFMIASDDLIAESLDRREGLARPGGQDEQAALSGAVGKREGSAQGVKGVDLMLKWRLL
jgi:hypothetical protein